MANYTNLPSTVINPIFSLETNRDYPDETEYKTIIDEDFVEKNISDYYGNYCIIDTVDRMGVFGVYRVGLFHRPTKTLIDETWSNSDGIYAFYNLAYENEGYFIVAFDNDFNTPIKNAAIVDRITPLLQTESTDMSIKSLTYRGFM